jgi:hypothetical protein
MSRVMVNDIAALEAIQDQKSGQEIDGSKGVESAQLPHKPVAGNLVGQAQNQRQR